MFLFSLLFLDPGVDILYNQLTLPMQTVTVGPWLLQRYTQSLDLLIGAAVVVSQQL